MLPQPLALQELLGWQEPGQQKGNSEKWLVNVNFNNFFVTTINTQENLAMIVIMIPILLSWTTFRF